MARQLYSRDSILTLLRTFIRTHHRLPTHTDYANRVDGIPSVATMYKYCPGFPTVLRQEAKTDPTLACEPPSRNPRKSAYWHQDHLFRRIRPSARRTSDAPDPI